MHFDSSRAEHSHRGLNFLATLNISEKNRVGENFRRGTKLATEESCRGRGAEVRKLRRAIVRMEDTRRKNNRSNPPAIYLGEHFERKPETQALYPSATTTGKARREKG